MTTVSTARATLTAPLLTPSATVSRVLTNPISSSRIIGTGVQATTIPSRPDTSIQPDPIQELPDTTDVIPMPRDESVKSATPDSLSTAEIREYNGIQYRAVPAAGVQLLVGLMTMLSEAGTFDAYGKTWRNFKAAPATTGVTMNVIYNDLMANGKAVIVAKGQEAGSMGILGMDDISEVSALTMNNEDVLLLSEPANGWPAVSSKALLYGGIAVAAVAGIGLIYYMTRK